MFFWIDVENRMRKDRQHCREGGGGCDSVADEPLFEEAYATTSRTSSPPEVPLKALLLQCLSSVRSERSLGERSDTGLLFGRFCGLDPVEPILDTTAFT